MQGPEIRTGFLKDAKPIQLTTGKEITITTDYEAKGDSETIAVRCALTAANSTFAPCSASTDLPSDDAILAGPDEWQRHMSLMPEAWVKF